jgi:hypothetical protein
MVWTFEGTIWDPYFARGTVLGVHFLPITGTAACRPKEV